jgi:glycosyltransferase involved in cell wall biosynthesis
LKISILSWDLSHNCLGRALVLGQLLKSSFEIEIIGAEFGKGVWKPFPQDIFTLKSVKGYCHPFYLMTKRDLASAVTGDLLYAVKPRPSSFGVALDISVRRNIPLILDIDDDELELFHPAYRKLHGLHTILSPNGYYWTRKLQKMISRADAVTTASQHFQNRFGGLVVSHARNHRILDPARYDSEKTKQQLGLDDQSVIMFLGTARRHKGIDLILEAMKTIHSFHPVLALVGTPPRRSYARQLRKSGGKLIRMYPDISFNRIGEYLAAADLVILPQVNSAKSIGQVPAKLIDAMMMGKPIIASSGTADIASMLSGCGVVIPPGDHVLLAEKIQLLLSNRKLAESLGSAARKQAVEKYSLEIQTPKLKQYLFQVIQNFPHS